MSVNVCTKSEGIHDEPEISKFMTMGQTTQSASGLSCHQHRGMKQEWESTADRTGQESGHGKERRRLVKGKRHKEEVETEGREEEAYLSQVVDGEGEEENHDGVEKQLAQTNKQASCLQTRLCSEGKHKLVSSSDLFSLTF